MSECMRVLADEGECQGDMVLVALVKLQSIVEKARQSPLQDDELRHGAEPAKPPPGFYARALQAELDDTMRHIPAELQSNSKLASHSRAMRLSDSD